MRKLMVVELRSAM